MAMETNWVVWAMDSECLRMQDGDRINASGSAWASCGDGGPGSSDALVAGYLSMSCSGDGVAADPCSCCRMLCPFPVSGSCSL